MKTSDRYTRRQLLACASGTALSTTAGCIGQLWSGSEENVADQVSLTIKTLPTDDDYLAASIMGQLRENLAAAGIDTTHEPVTEREFYRDILLERNYDVFVGRRPIFHDPDSLRWFLHSRFTSEAGWQNPFNFSNVTIDEYLEEQHSADRDDREEAVTDLLEHLERIAPYSVILFPYHLGGTRIQVPHSWSPDSAIGYFELLSLPSNSETSDPLRVGLFGQALSERFNPIAVDAGTIRPLLDLLYDPLARRIDGEYEPWLAESVTWDDSSGGRGLTATVTLRQHLRWHDDESIDESDVTFTYEFLEDTSLGESENAVPAAQYRGRQSIVDSVAMTGPETLEFEFETPSRDIAWKALTTPLLPQHVWEPRSEPTGGHQTDARDTDNEEPIGSGLFRLAELEDELLVFEPFRSHLLRDETVSNRPSILDGFSRYDGIEFHIVGPYPGVLVDMLFENEVDVIGTDLPPDAAESLTGDSDAMMTTAPSRAMYIVGYNFQHSQLGDPRFRSIISRLIDREHVTEEMNQGYGEKPESTAELVGLRSAEYESRTDTTSDVLTFPGTDGQIDETQVRRLFENEGYRYVDGTLVE